MRNDVAAMVDEFIAGRLTRRQLVWGLAALAAGAASGRPAAAAAQQRSSTFQALGLNHLALRVTDLDRSQAFYERHLGMTRIPIAADSPRLMACGPHVLNLFQAAAPRMDHVCFTVPDYDAKDAAARLRAQSITPDIEDDRVHFLDPDGYRLQVGGPTAGGQQPKALAD
jgi:catechol 2,3-dioxygenase-like lactoylglutathione lyase family enzyme